MRGVKGNQMKEIDHIKALTKEAETYRSHGLLRDAKGKYIELLEFLKSHERFAQNESLIETMVNKVKLVETEIEEIDSADDKPVLSEEAQNLIGRLFSFSDNQAIAAVEGAVALAKFGQYERALGEFERLTDEGIKIDANQNIEEITKHFNILIDHLRESYTDISNQSVQLMRYAKDLAQTYRKLQEEQVLKHKLTRYIGQNLLDKLSGSKEDDLFRNERREVTILFADIKSFTVMSEEMPAEDVVSMLNEYFSAMVEVIFENYGVLDKFVGDEIMSAFGQLPSGDNTPYYYAVKTAIEMQEAVKSLMKTRKLLGKKVFEIGIGINTGDAIIGNVGSKNRMDYTVIGDCVNTASRLQVVAEGGEIIVGADTYEKTKDQFPMEMKGKIKLKSKNKSLLCYKVLKE